MNREERHRILGDETVAHIRACVAEAPEPPDETVDALRRILAPVVRQHMEAERQRRDSA